MPCYLFTYHTYASWLPDRPEGYVRRHEGLLTSDEQVADQYKYNATQDGIVLDSPLQRLLIKEVLDACGIQDNRPHAVATDSTHIHTLLSWQSEKTWDKVTRSLKSSLTRRLNSEHGKREWLSEGRSRSHVKDREHFEYLMNEYLPKHGGLKWVEDRGWVE